MFVCPKDPFGEGRKIGQKPAMGVTVEMGFAILYGKISHKGTKDTKKRHPFNFQLCVLSVLVGNVLECY
jgi:hypothetical protein